MLHGEMAHEKRVFMRMATTAALCVIFLGGVAAATGRLDTIAKQIGDIFGWSNGGVP